jgi:antitoxin component YwqK of YwqJK toxin-antitoxin module
MKTVISIILLTSFLVASQNTYNAKNITQINNTLYDKTTKKLVDGVINAYFKSGSLQESIPCIKGIPNGIAIEYNESEKIIVKRTYKDGIITSITYF